MGNSRAPPPPPLNIAGSTTRTAASNAYDSPSSSKGRSSSYSSDYSFTSQGDRKDSTASSPGAGRRKPSSPTVNLHTHCGRHSDQYLFGGMSLAEMARSVWKRD